MGEQVKALAKKLADSADGNVEGYISMEESTQVTLAARLAELTTFSKILGTADDEQKELYKRMTPELARILRGGTIKNGSNENRSS